MAYHGKNPNLNSTVLANQGATPAVAAPTGRTRIINRDGTLFLVDDTGTEKEIGTGAGGKNYVVNSNAEINVTDDVTATTITVAAETGSPLEADQSFGITSLASAGDVEWDIDISDAYPVEGGILLGVSGFFRTDANPATGDWKVGIWNDTDSEYVGGTEVDLEPDLLNVYQSTFVPVTGKTYKMKLEFVEATTAGWVVDADLLKVTPDSSTAIQAFEQQTNWVDETVVTLTPSSGSVNYGRFRFSEDSNNQYWVDYAFLIESMTSGISQSTAMNLGGAVTISFFPAYTVEGIDGGRAFINSSSTTVQQDTNSVTTNMHVSGRALLNSKPSFFDDNIDDNKINLITPNLLKSNIKTKYRISSTAYVATTPMDFVTVDPDFPQVGTWTNVSGRVTIPTDGYYQITAFAKATGTIWTASQELFIYVDNVLYDSLYQLPSGSSQAGINGSTSLYLDKDQTISIRANGNVTLVAADSYFEVIRLADVGAHEAIGFAVATSNSYGLTLKKKYQQKFLSADLTADDFDNADLRMNNLVVGKTYRAVMQIVASTSASTLWDIAFFHDGARLSRFRFNGDDGAIYLQGFTMLSPPFVATTTTLVSYFDLQGSTGTIFGTGAGNGAWVYMIEDDNIVSTTDFT